MPRPRKSVEEHLTDGTYRPDRHGTRGPARLTPPPTEPDALVQDLDRLLEHRPPWLAAADDLALGLLRQRLNLRADLAAQAAAGDVQARRDVLAVDRGIDRLLDSLGLLTSGRARLDIREEPSPDSPLDRIRREREERRARLVTP